jgi:quinol monooxygenase YgiN
VKVEGEPGVYRIFDTFTDEAAREAHLKGEAGKEFAANAEKLFAEAKIHRLQVIAEK